MAGSATLTTVPSRNTTAVPRMHATSVRRLVRASAMSCQPTPVPTPARSLALPVRAGVRLLSADGGTWVDGGDGAARERIAAASDLASLSDELNRSWEIRYHLEPTPARAEVAALRTRDLESVAGRLEESPRERAYDAVILVGVREYVGGRDGLEDRVRMLGEAAARLRPGSTVPCAIENRLGVEYRAGAPEERDCPARRSSSTTTACCP